MTDQSIPAVDGVVITRKTQDRLAFWFLNLVVHRWMGLVALAWLCILGFTGIVLDQPEWRWAQQWTVTERFASDHVMHDQVIGNIVRKFHVNPENPQEMIGGGMRGLWRTADAGASWQEVNYAGFGGAPMLHAIIPSREDPWDSIWLGTDEGLWLVSGGGGEAEFVALKGQAITSLDYGYRPDTLVGVVSKSRIFSVSTSEPATVEWVGPGTVHLEGLPTEVSVARLMVDLHFGKGLTGGRLAMWINDFGGLVIIILSVTGLFYWFFPRRWRRPEVKAKWSKTSRRRALQWLFRFHGPILGLVGIVPIVYLSVTGIYMDHAASFLPLTLDKTVERNAAPGDYDLDSLNWQLDWLATQPDRPGQMLAMTRMGLIESADGGQKGTFHEATPLPVNIKHMNPGYLHRAGLLFTGPHGGPGYVRADGADEWQKVANLRMMVMDASPAGEAWILKGSRGFSRWTPADGSMEKLEIANPPVAGLPFYRFMTDLHSGMTFHEQFVWINDLASVVAILLCITGFIAWWLKKWI